MEEIFDLVKIIVLFQMVIISLLLLLAYGLKIYSYYQPGLYQRVHFKLEQLLLDWMKHPETFKVKTILPYKKHLRLLLVLIKKFDESNDKKWLTIRDKLMDNMVIPYAQLLAYSKAWEKRYTACLAFQLATKVDETTLIHLVKDPVPLVFINASIVAIKTNSKSIIDAIIDNFSASRRLPQALYTQIISLALPPIIPLIKNRLKRESNPYIKAFCYRTLAQLPFASEEFEGWANDFEINNLDLKLSILTYLSHVSPQKTIPFFIKELHDPRWEIRARAAKLLGNTGGASSAELLEDSLKDPAWWVRINAAEALAKLGKSGIRILKEQRPEKDQFAYDVAQRVLSTIVQ